MLSIPTKPSVSLAIQLFDFIVVGSGAGGATVAKELSAAGKQVLLLEKGMQLPPRKSSKAYSILKSEVEVWQSQCLGGTTVVTMGNAVRSRLDGLSHYYAEAERELGVTPVPEDHLGMATKSLLSLSDEWVRMPKAIDFSKCRGCGRCSSGCPTSARWDATAYVREAISSGCKVSTNSEIKKVVVKGNRATGVETYDGKTFEAGGVILAAGAIETPRVLWRSNITSAGKGLFVDTFVTVGGVKGKIAMDRELGMSAFIKRDGYLLSPHYSSFLPNLMEKKGVSIKPSDILSIMVKIEDEPIGEVTLNGIVKTISRKDSVLLERGKGEAIELLAEAGVHKDTIVSVHPRGAHPGGTCSKIVRSPLEASTEIESLYISDASIMPGPFGLPPMLTVIALAKRLSSVLLSRE
jgi:choline dehydrogenase-like flavoprotein